MNTGKKFTFNINSRLVLTLFSILLGIIAGAVILAFAGYNPFHAYQVILEGIFSRPKYMAISIIKATPLILTGLSVAFAFRTGLFNIGAEGQFIVGALAAAAAGYFIRLPAVLHIPVVFAAGVTAAGLWGALSGFLKARYGVHEVISTIMLNWIALYLNNFIIKLPSFHKPASEASYRIMDSARIDLFGVWKVSEEGLAFRAAHPEIGDLLKAGLNFGIVAALVLAFSAWFIINRTTLGYELRSVGFNKNAAEYGGINVNKSMILSMAFAGAFAGAAGSLHVMGVSQDITVLAAMEGYGFDGIAVALISGNSPLGCIWSGIFFGALKYGGTKIQPALGAPKEIVNIVIGMIVLFIAMPGLLDTVKKFIKLPLRRKKDD